MVAEPYYESLETGRRTTELVAELEIPDKRIVATKVHDEQDRDAFAECCDEHNLEISVTIPDDPTIRHADHDGTAPYETDADGETVRAIRDPADELARSHGKRVAER